MGKPASSTSVNPAACWESSTVSTSGTSYPESVRSSPVCADLISTCLLPSKSFPRRKRCWNAWKPWVLEMQAGRLIRSGSLGCIGRKNRNQHSASLCQGLAASEGYERFRSRTAANAESTSGNKRMIDQSIEISKMTPSIGAEILGIDLSQQLTDRQFQDVHNALMD